MRTRPLLLAALVFLLTALPGWTGVRLLRADARADKRTDIAYLAHARADALALELGRTLAITEVMYSQFVERDRIVFFDDITAQIVKMDRHATAVLLAPDGVISHRGPADGLGPEIGHDLLADPRSGPALRAAIEHQQLVVVTEDHAGAVVFSGWLPVWAPGEDGAQRFWGFTGVSVALPGLLAAARFDSLEQSGNRYRLVDISGPVEQHRAGASEPLDHPVTARITMPSLTLQIEVMPAEGWSGDATWWLLGVAVLGVAAALSSLAYGQFRRPELLRQQVARRTRQLQEEITQRDRAEASLATAEQRLRLVVANAPVIIFALDAAGVFTLSEGQGLESLGRAGGQVTGRSIFEVYQDQPEILKHIRRALAGEDVFYTTEMDGRIYDTRAVPVRDSEGRVTGVVGFPVDVSERVQAERSAQQERDFALQVMNAMGQGLTVTDAGGRFTFVNPAYARLVGLPADEVIGRSPFDFTSHATYETLVRASEERSQGAITTYETSLRRPDGAEAPVLITGVPVRRDGQHAGSIAVVTDLTERRESEDALRRSEKRYRSVVESVHDIIFQMDLTGRWTFLNPAWTAVTGFSLDESLGTSAAQILAQEDRATLARQFARLLAEEVADCRFEARAVTRSGEERWLDFQAQLTRDAAGRPTGIAGTLSDITDRRLAQQQVQLRERYLSAVAEVERILLTADDIESATDAVLAPLGVATGAGRVYVFRNRSNPEGALLTSQIAEWCAPGVEPQIDNAELQEFPVAEFMPRWVSELSAGREISGLVRDFPEAERAALEPQGIRSILVLPLTVNGGFWGFIGFDETVADRVWSPSEVALLRTAAGALSLAHERARTQAALREREAMLQTVVETSPVIITLQDSTGRLQYTSPQIRDVLGHEPATWQGRRPGEGMHPDDIPGAVRSFDRLLATGEPADARLRFRHADGRWVVLESRMRLLPGAGDGPAMVITASTDATRQAEVEEARERAREAAEEASRSKSDFLSRMSHELRTPLNAILGFAQLMEMDALTPDQDEGVRHIISAGQHLLSLINEILDISRIEAGRLALTVEPVPVSLTVRAALDLVAPLAAQRGIRIIDVTASSAGLRVRADEQRFKQVLLNLLSNAIKYNRDHGSVTVSATAAEPGQVRIAVSDTGEGIPAASIPKLFTPFERLGADARAIEGTGVGLALSRRLVNLMGGVAGVESVVGEGSTFWFTLPGAGAVPEPEPEPPALKLPDAAERAADRRVLYVEDNPANFKLVERVLAGRRHIALDQAICGVTGVARARAGHPDLVLLDLNLPDISGHEVLAQLRAAPDTRNIPVVILSADAAPEQAEVLAGAGVAAYLTKPLDIGAFLRTVDALLPAQDGQ